jgi:carbonic anhydrase
MNDIVEAALLRLKEGNQRYAAGQSVNAITDAETRRSLIGAQRPFVAVLGCADSRAIPELIFDAGIGELFVVRVAGNVINPQNNGSLEYAVEYLDVSLIVVLGHQNCGAVSATLDNYDGPGHIQSITEAISEAIDEAKDLPGDPLLNTVQVNARRMARLLRATEPILSTAVEAGTLRIVPAYYDFEHGLVEFLAE